MKIIMDIGGTFVRFAKKQGGEISNIQKFKVLDFASLEEALAHYSSEKMPVAIATASYCDNGVWQFVNDNPWRFTQEDLGRAGWPVTLILNDFEAATWAIPSLENRDVRVLDLNHRHNKLQKDKQDKKDKWKQVRSARSSQDTHSFCLLGPGTGLGLGYLHMHSEDHQNSYFVQKTHGGHFALASLTPEQQSVIDIYKKLKSSLDISYSSVAVFEDFVSGPGLQRLYEIICMQRGCKIEFQTAQSIFEHLQSHNMNYQKHMQDFIDGDQESCAHESINSGRDVEDVKEELLTSLRLFHEFLGLFSSTVTIAGHAYGGLYLTGGVVDRLFSMGLFDQKSFQKYFFLDCVSSVKDALMSTPVYHVKKSYLALHGLLVAMRTKNI